MYQQEGMASFFSQGLFDVIKGLYFLFLLFALQQKTDLMWTVSVEVLGNIISGMYTGNPGLLRKSSTF